MTISEFKKQLCEHDIILTTGGQVFAKYSNDIFLFLNIRMSFEIYKLIYEYFFEVLDSFLWDLKLLYPTNEK